MTRTWRCLALVVACGCSSSESTEDSGADAAADVSDATAKDAGSDATTYDATVSDAGADATYDVTTADAPVQDVSVVDVTVDVSPCDGTSPEANVTTLANGIAYAMIAVNATDVFWTAVSFYQSSVMKCAIGGCGGNPMHLVDVSGPNATSGVAVDDAGVYFTTYDFADAGGAGTIARCGVDGCDGGPTILAAAHRPFFIAIDATTVYWTDKYAGTVMACAKAGCGGSPTTIASGQTEPSGIAVDSTSVYWGTGDGALKRCPLAGCGDGGAPTTIYFYNGLNIAGIAVSGGYVYAAHAYTSGAIFKFPIDGDGGTYTLLADNEQGGAQIVATDGVNVYWTTDGTNDNVRKCSVDGCCMNPTTITNAPSYPMGIAVDGTNVYVATQYLSNGTAEQLSPK